MSVRKHPKVQQWGYLLVLLLGLVGVVGMAVVVFGGTGEDSATFGPGLTAVLVGMIGATAIYMFLNPNEPVHVPQLVCPHCKEKGQVWREDARFQETHMEGTAKESQPVKLNCKNCDSEWYGARPKQ